MPRLLQGSPILAALLLLSACFEDDECEYRDACAICHKEPERPTICSFSLRTGHALTQDASVYARGAPGRL